MKRWTSAEEAERLAKRFEGVNQAEFARQHNIKGGASMVSQHIHGRRPLSLAAAVAYARGFGCSLAEISPRLAEEVEGAASGEGAGVGLSPSIPPTRAALGVLGLALAEANAQTKEAVSAMLASYAKDPRAGDAIADAIALLLEPGSKKTGRENRKAA